MKIETKHNLGDKVFFIPKGQVIEGAVKHVDIQIYDSTFTFVSVIYTVESMDGEGSLERCEEDACFKTKKELLDSL